MNYNHLVLHYKNYGKKEYRFGSEKEIKEFLNDANFDLEFYRTNNPDLDMNYNHLVLHYKNYGKDEGRFSSEKEIKEFVEDEGRFSSEKEITEFVEDEGRFSSEKEITEFVEDEKYVRNLDNSSSNKKINIIGPIKQKCSFNDIMNNVEKYYLNLGFIVNIYDITEINKTYNLENNLICLNIFDIPIIDLINFKNKPSALWFWEFKSIPNFFINYEIYFEKIYVISEFCKEIFSKVLSIPVEKIKLTFEIHEYLNIIPHHQFLDKKVKEIINITNGKIRYGFCFDISSSIIRKNVLNLVRAFSKIKDTNKILIIKLRIPKTIRLFNNYEKNIYKEILKIVDNCYKIFIIDQELDKLDLYKLYSYFDYYISPHCGEGYGLTIYDNMIIGNKIISPYYSGEKDFLKKGEFIELEYEEKEIDGLIENPIYSQMTDFKGAYISEEEILKVINSTTSEEPVPTSEEPVPTSEEPLPTNNIYDKPILVIDCQPLQHEIRGIGRYGVNLINTIINKSNFFIKLIINNFSPKNLINKIQLNKNVEIINVVFEDISYFTCEDDHNRLINRNDKEEYDYEIKLAKIINNIKPDIFLNISEFDRVKVMINLDLLNKNIKTYSILYDIIPLKQNWISIMSTKDKNIYLKQVENLKKYNKLLSISNFTKNDCSEFFNNILNIGTGVYVENKHFDNNVVKETLQKFGIKKKYIFCQTAFGENKSLHLLFNQYNLLPNRIKKKILLVFGSEIPEYYVKKHKLNENPNVIITGYLSEDDLWILHENAWLFVFPSSYEGFGLPPVEAMYHNKPVIVAKNTSLIEIMENDKYMFNNNNNSCSELIIKMYVNKDLYNECKEYCSERHKLFTWDNVFSILVNEFKIIITKKVILNNSTDLIVNKNIGITCSCDLNDDNINNFENFKGADGLSIVMTLLTNSRKYIMNKNISKLVNNDFIDSNINFIFNMPTNIDLIKDNMINIIYTMFESNKLPNSWSKNISKCDYCIVPSDEIKKVFINSGINIPIHSINLPLEKCNDIEAINYFKPKINYWEKNRPFYVGCIGNWKKRKNYDKLINAVDNIVLKKGYNIILKFHFAYWYDFKHKEEFINLYNKYKNIIEFTEGVKTIEEKYEFIKGCDLLISCSSGEGFSYTPREGLIMKVPVLITDVLGHTDIIKSNYCNIISTDKNIVETGDYNENNFDGTMTKINTKNIQNSIIQCYDNYEQCIEKSKYGYYWFYEKSMHYIFENKIQKFIKNLLPKKKLKNKKVLLYFPCVFYPPTDGCHTVVLEQIKEMIDRNYELHIYTTHKTFGNNSWNDNSVNYFTDQGIKITIMDYNEELIKQKLIKDIELYQFGIIRINYQPELYWLGPFFDYLNENKDNELYKSIIYIYDTHDDVKLSFNLQEKLYNTNDIEIITDKDLWSKNIDEYYKKVRNTSCKNIISVHQSIFDIIINLNSYESYIFEKSINYNQMIIDYIYTIPKNVILSHKSRNKIIFIGSNNIFNIQALKYFIKKVLPLLPEDFNINLYGSICDFDLIEDKRFIKHGRVENIEEVFTDTLFSIVPILCGTGSKIKIFDSLIHKIPVVTFINNRCLITEQGRNCYFVGDEFEFAETCIKLKNNPDLCKIEDKWHNEFVIDKINNIKNDFYSTLENN